eukprot:CAMPEP_0176495884 /NCGR_PEP_ID=MMETSP0200_2-20121128/10901_1 /TAXON_ID=947934 /ORGANISM="Chaetoceros sp., Strain GSL56" /LENGTH=313 /DNA_ID=CAMNT_0017893805 /DNA_START=212 /DNA_END=1153 /DNA_ORIENTATION=+
MTFLLYSVSNILLMTLQHVNGFSIPKVESSVREASRSSLIKMKVLPFTQVISDVDDTLKSSGGVKIGDIALGGIDRQYQRGEFYPGVFQFMFELSISSFELKGISAGESKSHGLAPPKVAVLTARAEEFKVALELKEDSNLAKAFRKTGEDHGVENWGLGPVLYGSVAEWIIQDRKGLRKFSNFERLMSQDPTGEIIEYVYVGDTGELDQEAGETMLREYPEVVKAVFLHVVSEDPDPIIPNTKLINGRPLVFFRTYVGAAVSACRLGFISESAMMRVVAAAEQSLDSVERTSDKWQDLYRDVTEAYTILDSN